MITEVKAVIGIVQVTLFLSFEITFRMSCCYSIKTNQLTSTVNQLPGLWFILQLWPKEKKICCLSLVHKKTRNTGQSI